MTLRKDMYFGDKYDGRDAEIASVQANFDARRRYSSEGYEVMVGLPGNFFVEWVIIQEHTNPLHEEKDIRQMHAPLDLPFNRGDYVIANGEYWLIFSDKRNNDGAYYTVQLRKCNYLLKWIDKQTGEIVSFWCVVMSKNPYSPGVWNNAVAQFVDGQAGVALPIAPAEIQRIRRDDRFILSNNKVNPRSYFITDMKDAVMTGLIVWSLKEDALSIYDDTVEMIADRYKFEGMIQDVTDGVAITGAAVIFFNDKQRYTARLMQNGAEIPAVFTFTLSGDTADIEIIETGADYIVIGANETRAEFTIEAAEPGGGAAEINVKVRDFI